MAIREFSDANPSYLTSGEDLPTEVLDPILAGMVRSGAIMDQEVEALEEALAEIDEIDLTPEFYRSSLPDFLTAQRQRRLVNRTLASGLDPKTFAAQATSVVDEVRSLSSDSRAVYNALDDDEFLPDEDQPLMGTGISSVDALLDGGIPRGKTAMLCAYTGVGKTGFGLNICRNNARIGFRSAFVSVEMPPDEVMRRYHAMTLRYSYTLIHKGDPTGERTRAQINEEVMELKRSMVRSDPSVRAAFRNFDLIDLSERQATHLDLEQHIQRAIEEGNPYQLMVIDYIDIMTLPEGRAYEKDRKETRDMLGRISDEIRRIAVKYQMWIWILTQANDEGEKNPNPGMRASRDSRKKNDPVSVWASLGGTEKELAQGIFNFRVAKNRDGRKFTVKLRGEGEFQTFEDYQAEDDLAERFSPGGRRRGRTLEDPPPFDEPDDEQ